VAALTDSSLKSDLILRARVVLPVGRAPLENGAVLISGDRIVSVGRWPRGRRPAGLVVDLGASVLLPGLVNAHCHLDYTHMAGLFPPPRKFTDWIKLITSEKGLWDYSDYAASWIAGAKMLLQSGTTTVADIEAVPELLPEVWETTPLRVISQLELTGVRSRRHPQQILREALQTLDHLPLGRCRASLSPHAPYSTTPMLLRRAAAVARRRKLRLATHVAESALEFDMFQHARGEMFDWLARNHRDMRDCGGRSPVQQLARCQALGAHLLAIHVNYLAPGDAELLARKRVSVVHCPRSHDYFGHAEFPRRALAKAGVNLCLGTDSLASVRKHPSRELELNLGLEMRTFAKKNPGVSPRQILEMATINGARALGARGRIGELKPGAFADLIALPYAGPPAKVAEAVVHHSHRVNAGMIGGDWTIPPGSGNSPG
jgi:cytosine/adenosine deaminase-related metal-dependent hydrolase